MTKILFICHGNICRSPMAEFIMKDLVCRAGLSEQFQISSAATSTEEIGNPVYPPVRKLLTEHGISCAGKTARQLTNADYDQFDRNMYRICGGDYADKMHLLGEYAGRRGDIPDPWYTRDFHATWQAVEAGCQGLLEQLRDKTDGDKQAKSLYRH